MWLKSLHRGSAGRLKSLHRAVVPACSCCRTGAPSSCGGALPAHNCDSLAGVLGSPGRGTHLCFNIYPGEQHGEWRPAVRPVAGAPLCHDPVNGKSNTIPSTEQLKALDVQTNCWLEQGRQGNCTWLCWAAAACQSSYRNGGWPFPKAGGSWRKPCYPNPQIVCVCIFWSLSGCISSDWGMWTAGCSAGMKTRDHQFLGSTVLSRNCLDNSLHLHLSRRKPLGSHVTRLGFVGT